MKQKPERSRREVSLFQLISLFRTLPAVISNRSCRAVLLWLILSASVSSAGQVQDYKRASHQDQAGLPEIQNYISKAWDALTRDMTSCSSIRDPKARTAPVIYLPADFAMPASLTAIQRECHAR